MGEGLLGFHEFVPFPMPRDGIETPAFPKRAAALWFM